VVKRSKEKALKIKAKQLLHRNKPLQSTWVVIKYLCLTLSSAETHSGGVNRIINNYLTLIHNLQLKFSAIAGGSKVKRVQRLRRGCWSAGLGARGQGSGHVMSESCW